GKAGGKGTSVIPAGVTLNDTGGVQAGAGTLRLRGGGSVSGAGTLTAAAGAILDLPTGTYATSAGPTSRTSPWASRVWRLRRPSACPRRRPTRRPGGGACPRRPGRRRYR